MSFEIESKITGELVKNSVIISNQSVQNELLSRGYGEKFEKELILSLKKKKNMSFDELLQIYKKNNDDIFTKFLIYRDLRNRGYVVKNGFGFGSDFLVYEKGCFGQKGAKYLIFALNEGTQEKIVHIQKNIEQITKMGKDPIIAVIERRGEVIYYKISKVDFLKNEKDSQVIDFNF